MTERLTLGATTALLQDWIAESSYDEQLMRGSEVRQKRDGKKRLYGCGYPSCPCDKGRILLTEEPFSEAEAALDRRTVFDGSK